MFPPEDSSELSSINVFSVFKSLFGTGWVFFIPSILWDFSILFTLDFLSFLNNQKWQIENEIFCKNLLAWSLMKLFIWLAEVTDLFFFLRFFLFLSKKLQLTIFYWYKLQCTAVLMLRHNTIGRATNLTFSSILIGSTGLVTTSWSSSKFCSTGLSSLNIKLQ